MGLRFASDLAAWRRWDAESRRLQRLAAVVRRKPAATLETYLATRGVPSVVVVLESRAASSLLAFVSPLAHLDSGALYASFDPTPYLPGSGWNVRRVANLDLAAQLSHVRTVVAAGNYLALSGLAYEQAVERRLSFVVVQHGLLTPFAPPLPIGSHLLAWSSEDAAFWRSDRSDVTTAVIGSQLLWEAAHAPRVELTTARPVFLGQLHGAELPRLGLTRAAVQFCGATGATYRPHPSERDVVSRLEHRGFSLLRLEVDTASRPLAGEARPMVAAYSTGLLEAAARGFPAWAYYPAPPAWLREFWSRYGLSTWGDAPTPSPALERRQPAAAVAERLLR